MTTTTFWLETTKLKTANRTAFHNLKLKGILTLQYILTLQRIFTLQGILMASCVSFKKNTYNTDNLCCLWCETILPISNLSSIKTNLCI